MADGLTKHGLFIDYLYRLRVLDPSVKSESSELNEKCTEYTESRLYNSYAAQLLVDESSFVIIGLI